MALDSWEGPLSLLKLILLSTADPDFQPRNKGTEGHGTRGRGGSIHKSRPKKNAIIQEMIEEFLQDQPEESFSLNSGGLGMLSTQFADSSSNSLCSNKDRRVERGSL